MSKDNLIDYIIGLPPYSTNGDVDVVGKTNEVMRNSMPLVRIYPGVPSYTEGLSLFTRGDAFGQYTKLLNSHGFSLQQPNSNKCIVAAYQADSFPTDSFTNEYGENFFQKMTDIASEGASSVSQMFGVRSVGQAADKIAGITKDAGYEKIGGAMSSGAEAAGNIISSMGKHISGAANLASALATGSRIDFPMIWKGSSFQPSYTMTIRLYNPNPASDEATKKYIVGPIAALLLLAIPQSVDGSGSTYSWPFIHRIHSPGIYDLDPAFISNITIIKGGDQQQISYKQKLSVVDIRIDFGSLYNSLLASTGINRTRPTLKSYLSSMYGPGQEKPVTKFSSTGFSDEEITSRESVSSVNPIEIAKNQAPIEQELTIPEIKNPVNRVSAAIKNTADSIISQIPTGFKISLN